MSDGPAGEADKTAAVVAQGSDACGSGETLESLGVQGEALASLLQRPAQLNPDQADPNQPQEALDASTLLNEQGFNAMRMRCKYCGTSILPAGAVKLLPDVQATLPPMPKKRGADEDEASAAGPEMVQGFWHVTDKWSHGVQYVRRERGTGKRQLMAVSSGGLARALPRRFDFDNMGATKAVDGGIRFIICGECDLGPFGWFQSDKDMYVSVSRVRYELYAE